MMKNGLWGSICLSGWDHDDAGVVCRMLGYDNGYSLDIYRNETLPIWLGDVECSGEETELANCYYKMAVTIGTCMYGYDAGVLCYNDTGKVYTFII